MLSLRKTQDSLQDPLEACSHNYIVELKEKQNSAGMGKITNTI